MIGTYVLLLTLPILGWQGADSSNCADCHFANPGVPGQNHLHEWDLSAHGRHQVGCESCHGGDPSTFEELAAHMNLLSPTNPASPVARRQLPSTCGKCHIGPFVAFQGSAHYRLLKEGDRRTPICSTCHGNVGAHLLSPARLERKCLSCHGNEKSSRAQDPMRARRMLEQVDQVRKTLATVEVLIEHLRPKSGQEPFGEKLRQAQVPLTEAVEMAHSFDFEPANERLELAIQRSQALLQELVNR